MDLSGKTLPSFCWTTAYILFICYNTIILFGEVLELYYLETLKTTMLKIFSYHKQYRHSLRTVGELPNEHTIPSLHSSFYLYVIIHFFYIRNAYTLIIRHVLCHTYVCMILVFNATFNNISVISWKPPTCHKSLTNFITERCSEYTTPWPPIVYIWQYNMFKSTWIKFKQTCYAVKCLF